MFSRSVQAEINCKSKIDVLPSWLTEIRWLYNVLMDWLIRPNSDKWMLLVFFLWLFAFSLTQLFSQCSLDLSILFRDVTEARVSYPSRSATKSSLTGLVSSMAVANNSHCFKAISVLFSYFVKSVIILTRASSEINYISEMPLLPKLHTQCIKGCWCISFHLIGKVAGRKWEIKQVD